MDRGAWRATVHGVTERWTQLSTHTHTQTTASFPYHEKLKAHKILQWDSFLLTTATDPGKSRKHTHTHTHTDHSQISLSLLWLSYCTELRPREIDLGASVRLGTKGNNLVVINLILAPGNSTHY